MISNEVTTKKKPVKSFLLSEQLDLHRITNVLGSVRRLPEAQVLLWA